MPSDTGRLMQQLYTEFGELAGITIELHRDLPAIRVDNQQATATIFLQGAQLSHYQKKSEPPTLWCSPSCSYQSGVPLRGGVPICWPWFGALDKSPAAVREQIPDNNQAHGFVRNKNWTLQTVEIVSPNLSRLQLSFSMAENEYSLWPFATDLILSVDIGEQLEISLQIINNSNNTVAFTTALHSYFATGDINQTIVEGLEGVNYVDCMDKWQVSSSGKPIKINREIDRIYQGSTQKISLRDDYWQRSIQIDSHGSNSAIVWNPWIDKAQRLSDYEERAYKEMLCIETANAGEDVIVLKSGDRHRLGVSITSSQLAQ